MATGRKGTNPARRTKGVARQNALALFGITTGRMETPEQRESTALVLRLSQNEKIRALATMMMMAEWKGVAMTTIMEKLQITYGQLAGEYKELQRSQGFIRAAQHLPEIMEQVAIDAKHSATKCETCAGSGEIVVYDHAAIEKARSVVGENTANGFVSDPEMVKLAEGRGKCAICGGRGEVVRLADPEKVKLVFDTFGLTGKGGGVAVNLDLRKLDGADDLGELAGSLGTILEGSSGGTGTTQ
ncbi:MAG TPA: hypothetical protein VN039_11100 [Nitrospira sp.]|nr:hypothetical protein [Nitrospira sp.]